MIRVDYDALRPLFGGKLTPEQVSGIDQILETYEAEGHNDIMSLCYIMATAKWETAHTMQPIKETQKPADKIPLPDATVIRRLDTALAGGKLGNVKEPYWRDGWFGRGHVQITHERNYKGPAREAVMEVFAQDIYLDRDAVMRPTISAFILVRGMTEGWFTGKRLANYLTGQGDHRAQYKLARGVVNGSDKADEIADLALNMEKAFSLKFEPAVVPKPGLIVPQKKLVQVVIDFFLSLIPRPKR